MSKRMKSEILADELYGLVEYDQGKAYISDGIGNQTTEQIFAIARQSLALNKRLSNKLTKWLKAHEQLKEQP